MIIEIISKSKSGPQNWQKNRIIKIRRLLISFEIRYFIKSENDLNSVMQFKHIQVFSLNYCGKLISR